MLLVLNTSFLTSTRFYRLLYASVCFCMLHRLPDLRPGFCAAFRTSGPRDLASSRLSAFSSPVHQRWVDVSGQGAGAGLKSSVLEHSRTRGRSYSMPSLFESVNVENSVEALVRFVGDSGSRPRRIPALTNWSPAARGCTVL